jgi:hypothetical protein
MAASDLGSGRLPQQEGAIPVSQHGARFPARKLIDALKAAGPPLLFGLRLWASVSLALYVAFWLELDNPVWAGTSAAIVCQPHLGASLRKGWYRMIGTVVGAVMSVVLAACFPQDRVLFLGALALWGGMSALAATLLRNFAAYAAALAGYTAAIVAGDLLGATGGVNADAAFLLAVSRGSEIIIGIVCAGVVLAATDLGDAPRRLAELFADIASEIASRFTGTLTAVGANFDDTQRRRWELVRRVIALDPVIDEAIGESSQLRYHSPVLQRAVDGLFTTLVGWRAVANHLVRLSDDEARRAAAAMLESMPQQLQSASEHDQAARWTADPIGLHHVCMVVVQRLIALPAETPSLRLLADQTANVLAGMAQALNGLALLVADPARRVPRRGSLRLRVSDWLPALVNAGRAFRRDRRRCAVLDRHRMAEWRLGDQLHCDHRHPARAASRSGLCQWDRLLAGKPRQRRSYGDNRVCGAAGIGCGELCRLQLYHRALSGTHRRSAGQGTATLADRDVYRHDDDFHAAARSDEPDGLQHSAILQRYGCDPRRHRRRPAVVSVIAAIVAGVPLAPAVGIDLARFPPPRDGSHISRLVWSHRRPPRDDTGRGNTAAARSAAGGAFGW